MSESINIGAGWKKESENVGKYISCKLNNCKYFAIFPNTKKTKDGQPDYRLVMDLEDAESMDLLDGYTKGKRQE